MTERVAAMTINEYCEKVVSLLKKCQTEKEAISVLDTAQKVLDSSNISSASQKQFWIELYEALGGDDYVLIEKQAGSALSDIVSAAKKVIAQKVKR